MAISFNSFATTVSSMGAVGRPKDNALNWYVQPWTRNLICPGLFLYWYMGVGVLEIFNEVTHSHCWRMVLMVSERFGLLRPRIGLQWLLFGFGTKQG